MIYEPHHNLFCLFLGSQPDHFVAVHVPNQLVTVYPSLAPSGFGPDQAGVKSAPTTEDRERRRDPEDVKLGGVRRLRLSGRA